MAASLDDHKNVPKIAKIHIRVFAAILDFVILIFIFVVVGMFYGEKYTTDEGSGFHLTGLPALVSFSICWIIYPLQEALTGQTIGKRVFNIKVVSQDNKPHSFGQPIIRHIFDVIDIFPCIGLTGIVVASNTKMKQRVGDLVAKTIVVNK